MTALLAFDRREVREDLAGADLGVCERDREVFAARLLRFAHPAAADLGRGLSGEDAVVRLAVAGFFSAFFSMRIAADRFIIARVPSKPALVSVTYPSAFAMGVSFSFPWLSTGNPLFPSTPDRKDGLRRV